MPKYNKLYRGQFSNYERDPDNNDLLGSVVVVDIYDTESGEAVEATEIIDLAMADNPFTLETIDNDEDKFTVIKATRGIVNFHSSNSIGIETFLEGGDTRYYGEVYVQDGETLLLGFVSIADIQEEFQPDPNVISLIINDGLGFLDDEDLVDEDGEILSGVHNIWYYIRLALLKTGLNLGSLVGFNTREKTAVTLNNVGGHNGHFFVHEYLEAKTFEGENVGTMLKCREVLEKILFGCYLCQHNGSWWIINPDEVQADSDLILYGVDTDGVFSKIGGIALGRSIGDGLALSWMNDDAVVSAERPNYRVDLVRNYEYPKEIPCNVDFERGIGDTPTGAASETIDSDPECWTYLREGVSNVDLDSQPYPGSLGKLRKLYEFSYEKERYLVTQQAGGFRHYFKCEHIRMDEKARLNISVNYWFDSDVGGATINVMHIRLIGNDGNIYDLEYLDGTTNQWVQKVASDPVFDQTIQEAIGSALDMRDQHVFSFETASVPVGGLLYIRLLNDLASPLTRFFSGLRVDYVPLVNGSLGKYTGERHRVEQTGNFKAFREDNAYIGSGPSVNVKGALLKRGDNQVIFTGTIQALGGANQIEISGDKRAVFSPYINERIIIDTPANDLEATLNSVSYSIIGNVTTLVVSEPLASESSVSGTISIATYELAELFYNALVLPDGPFEDAQSKPYGEQLVFNIWNQYNRVMRKFEGTIDGTDSYPPEDTFRISLIVKFTMADPNFNSGTRVFMLLHYSADLKNCQANECLFHEVHDPAVGKQYTGHEFKYLTQ